MSIHSRVTMLMIKTRFKISFLLRYLFPCLLLTGCATSQPSSKDQPSLKDKYSSLSQQQNLPVELKASIFEAILTAEIAEQQGDYPTALSHYLFAADISKERSLIAKTIALAEQSNDLLAKEQAAKMWVEHAKKTSKNELSQAQLTLLEAQLGLFDLDASINTLEDLLKGTDSEQQAYDLLAAKILKINPRMAMAVLNELDKKQPGRPAFLTISAQLLFEMALKPEISDLSKQAAEAHDNPANNQEQRKTELLNRSLKTVERALQVEPLFLPAVRVKSYTLFQLHQDTKARSYLTQLFLDNPESKAIALLLGQLIYDLKDYNSAVTHFASWLYQNPEDKDAIYYLAASHYALGQFQPSLEHFFKLTQQNYQLETTAFYCGDSAQKVNQVEKARNCFSQVKSGHFLAAAKLQLANIAMSEKNYDQALAILTADYSLTESEQTRLTIAEITLLNNHFSPQQAKQRLELARQVSPDNVAFVLKQIELDNLLDKPEQLFNQLQLAKSLLAVGPKLDRFVLASAAFLKNNHYPELAIDWLDQAILVKPDDRDLLYTRALYKESLDRSQEMLEELRYLLQRFPNDPDIKNALGYTLADQNIELDYAEALIDSAYLSFPNNPAVIDSKGWLAYRKNDLKTAIELLNRAFQLQPSAEGAAHLGEVLWMNDAKKAALLIWQQGQKLDNDNKVLKETLNRLKVDLDD